MMFFWDTVPPQLRSFYERGYLREGWLESALPGQRIPRETRVAQRLAIINAEVIFAEGPGVNVEDVLAAISMGFVSAALAAESPETAELIGAAVAPGFSLATFASALAEGDAVSRAIAKTAQAQPAERRVDMLGRKMTTVLAGQRALETAAIMEARSLDGAPPSEWPKHMKRRLAATVPQIPALALLLFLRDVGVSEAAATAVFAERRQPLASVGGDGMPGVWGPGDQMRIANELATRVVDLDGFPTPEGRAYALRFGAPNSAPANLYIQTFLYGGDLPLRAAQTRAVYIDTAQSTLLPLDFGNPGSGWMLLASRTDPGPWKEPSES